MREWIPWGLFGMSIGGKNILPASPRRPPFLRGLEPLLRGLFCSMTVCSFLSLRNLCCVWRLLFLLSFARGFHVAVLLRDFFGSFGEGVSAVAVAVISGLEGDIVARLWCARGR